MALPTTTTSPSPPRRTSSMATMGGKRQSWITGLHLNSYVKHHFAARGSISSVTSTENNNSNADHDNDADDPSTTKVALCNKGYWTKRRLALVLSLWVNLLITGLKLFSYIQTGSLSVLASLLDSVLDVISQLILSYTERKSSQPSSALYPAGNSRLEPIGVLACAVLMGMASLFVLQRSIRVLIKNDSSLEDMDLREGMDALISFAVIIVVKLLLLWQCKFASKKREIYGVDGTKRLQSADPTIEALAQDHLNDVLSNGVAMIALLLALYSNKLWWCDAAGAILISLYIIYSWYSTGKEQIEHLTGKAAPEELIDEFMGLAERFHGRLIIDTCRAYHFGPKFLVEIEVVMPADTPLKKSHDLGMELQYEIEGKDDVERCFVHIDYEKRGYDEHVVSKVPELQEYLLLRQEVELDAILETKGNILDVVGVEDKNTDQQAQVADNNDDDKNSSSARRSSNGEPNTDHNGLRSMSSHEEEKEKRASINAILADDTITSRERRQSIQTLIDNRRRRSYQTLMDEATAARLQRAVSK